jgi:hypothetical protein
MPEKNKNEVTKSRRDFVKSAGKLAAYAPPAMVVLMKPSNVAFARSGGTIGSLSSWSFSFSDD